MADKRVDLTEMDKLENMLKRHEVYYERTDSPGFWRREGYLTHEKHQIRGLDREHGKELWDVVCNLGTFGAEDGLLEYWDCTMKNGEDPEGYMNALAVFDLIYAKGFR